ncbi:MAG: response regulator transcription factor [Chloroflexota bacterium]
MTSLMLVEDHPIVAKTLSRILEQRGDLHVTAVALTAEDALEQLPGLNPDIVLVDVSLPKMNGIELAGVLHERYPHLPCLIISGHVSGHYVQRSMEAGARGYVIKDSVAGILEGIEQVLQGKTYVSKELREA